MFSKFIYLVKSVYFNLHYLPFKQAIKLPIIIYDVNLKDLRGTVKIVCDEVSRGMIRIGHHDIEIFPKSSFVWQNQGGDILFKGKCHIGASGGLSIEKNASLIFNDDFRNTYGLKLIVSRRVEFGISCRIGWNTLIMDSNMHPLVNKLTGKKSSGGAPVVIGDYNWISSNCVVLPGTKTPERVICALGSVVARGFNYEPYCMYGGSPIHLIRENVYRDYDNDKDEMVYQK